jgi:hypothetical protein
MTDEQTGNRRRVARRRRRGSSAAALCEIDRSLLGVLCAHRVVTQAQLGRLFPGVPERTLRYRTRRLHDLGWTGRSRPYREQGSAPNHHWPTRRADCMMRGEPVPRGGERTKPNPSFLAHAAALTELYVALATEAGEVGLSLQEYRREGEAREPFDGSGKQRALAPDAMVILVDREGRKFGAFVEIDLGSMSHTRLRQKAELYAAYAASDAWHEQHLFLPALLFLTTTDARASKFLGALARALSYGPREHRRRPFVAGAAGIAWAPHRLLDATCLADLTGNVGLALADILLDARAPHEQALAYQREREEADEVRRQVLRDDPEAMRRHLADYAYELTPYIHALGTIGERVIELLRTSTTTPTPDEREALRAIARDLDQALPEPQAHELPEPGASVHTEITMLAEHYRTTQARQIETLAQRHGDGPCLRRGRELLRDGGVLDRDRLDRLPPDAERDAAGRRKQHERRDAYLAWREHVARRLAKEAGLLGRLTHRAEGFYPQLDRERLRTCGCCAEMIYPPAREAGSYGSRQEPSCHFCREPQSTEPYDPAATSPTRTGSEVYG